MNLYLTEILWEYKEFIIIIATPSDIAFAHQNLRLLAKAIGSLIAFSAMAFAWATGSSSTFSFLGPNPSSSSEDSSSSSEGGGVASSLYWRIWNLKRIYAQRICFYNLSFLWILLFHLLLGFSFLHIFQFFLFQYAWLLLPSVFPISLMISLFTI